MNEIQKYIAAHEPKMMDDLFSLIRIPSISALPEHHDDMLACAERWAQLLLEAGVDEALVMPSQGNPVVFAQKIVNPDAKTVLIYAHYDVMPAEPLELWKSEPFEPEIRDGHIWARGADDDKGQSFIQVKAFEYLVKNGLLKNNVKFIFEGEEEIGSPSLEAFCEEHKELLKADVILVSDTSMLGAELPSLTTGLRGLAYWEIEVTGPNRDLHSGHFGGAVANPINALCQIISKVTDADGRITVPGFYDDVEEVPQTEREMIAHIPFDEKKYKEAIGVKELFGEKGYSTLERNSCRPSFDVCGIWGGYTGEGSKTVLPSKAYAKVSCRLVPHQDHHKISQMFADYILSIAPDTVQVKVTPMHGGQGYVPDFTSCLSGSRERFRDRFREKAVGGTPWRKYSHHLYFRTGIGNQNRIDGIWTRIECDPFSERELLIGYLPERDRGSHRVSSGICQTIKRINNNQVINDTYKRVVNKLDYKHLSTTLLYIYHTDKLHDRSLEKEGK